MKQNIKIRDLADIVLKEMGTALFSTGTISNYARIFNRLEKLAERRKKMYYTSDLGRSFMEDSSYSNSEDYCHTRYCLHYRCIQFIESYLADGKVDWAPHRVLPEYSLVSKELSDAQTCFWNLMVSAGLKANTMVFN
jgi:hypothetical protein